MNTRTKTRKVAVYADGHRVPIVRRGGMWHWGDGNASSHMDGVAFRLAAEYGGHIETEPNPSYRPPRELTPYEVLGRMMSGRR